MLPMNQNCFVLRPWLLLLACSLLSGGQQSRGASDGDATVAISGSLQQWHKVTVDLNGPFAHERDEDPNPFTDYAYSVTFVHQSGSPQYVVPGYFAADGDAANTSAELGTCWRAHLSPDKPGRWDYQISFHKGRHAALDPDRPAEPLPPYDGVTGSFEVAASDKTAPDFRAVGRLQYAGRHHLQFAGSGTYFLKAGADAPETLLAYEDFDGTEAGNPEKSPLKSWAPHLGDWKPGDPVWQEGKGKGLVGALNYLSAKGVNAFSFLTYNAGGDGDNVWPFVARNEKLHYDCSKLDQWGIVFDHATSRGLYLHFKTQENEMDDNRRGAKRQPGTVPESLDGGALGPERRLYYRELVARFGHALALNWNLGEENTQSADEIRELTEYIDRIDPYDHLIVIHTFPDQQDEVYTPLLGDRSHLTGASLQNHWDAVHQRTLRWIEKSAAAGKPWVCANDEQGPATEGVPPDPGYRDFDGRARDGQGTYTMHDIRKATLWGNLMAGGAGVEYYFGYRLPENDLTAEDFRSRDKSWDFCRIALEFFDQQQIPFWDMRNADEAVGNTGHDNSRYCLAQPGQLYLVYLPDGGTTDIDLTGTEGTFTVRWFNPRAGGALQHGSREQVDAGARRSVGAPPATDQEDWLVILRRQQ